MESNIRLLLHSLKTSVFKGPADTAPQLRQAIQDKLHAEVNTGDSAPLASPVLDKYVEKVARHAYKVVDQDVEKLKAEGFSEAEIFELTIAAGWAAGLTRYARGLELLNSVSL